jgi:phenylalanyl-tRNA synthetase beta subunit
MPAQISDVEKFVRISERAEECRVKRLEDVVKLKLRTPSRLYTMKLNAEEAAEVLKRLKCEVVET